MDRKLGIRRGRGEMGSRFSGRGTRWGESMPDRGWNSAPASLRKNDQAGRKGRRSDSRVSPITGISESRFVPIPAFLAIVATTVILISPGAVRMMGVLQGP